MLSKNECINNLVFYTFLICLFPEENHISSYSFISLVCLLTWVSQVYLFSFRKPRGSLRQFLVNQVSGLMQTPEDVILLSLPVLHLAMLRDHVVLGVELR